MNWKQRLALATGAFVSMSGTAVNSAECSNTLRRRTSLRRRAGSAPMTINLRRDAGFRTSVRLPGKRLPGTGGGDVRDNACRSYTATATMLRDNDPNDITDNSIKVEVSGISPGRIATMDFNFQELGISESTPVAINISVTPEDEKACASAQPLVSTVLYGSDGQRTFIPMQGLNSARSRQPKSRLPGDIIKPPPGDVIVSSH